MPRDASNPNAEPFQHLLWDWNGTLLDDAWLCVEALNAQLREAGLTELSLESYRERFGFPVKPFYERLGFPSEAGHFERSSVRFMDAYHAREAECQLHAGLPELLQALQAAGWGMSILSASRQDHLERMVRRRGLVGFFDQLRGTDNIHAQGKLGVGRAWLQQTGYAPATVLMIGDTLHDAEVAKALGCACVLISHGHNSAQRLATSGAPVVPAVPALKAWFDARLTAPKARSHPAA